MTQYDILYCLGPKDREVFEHSLAFLRKNVLDYSRIWVVARSDPGIAGVTWVDESKYPFSVQDVNSVICDSSRAGWYFQQLLKLYAPSVIPDLHANWVVVDSDTCFLRPIRFMEDGKYLLNTTMEENHLPYYEHMKRCHPEFQKVSKASGVCHHMVFNRDLLSEMISYVEMFHLKPFWRVFLECVDPSQRSLSGASEYEIYFNFLLNFHSNLVKVRSLPFTTFWGEVASINENLPYAYVSKHWWTKPKEHWAQLDKQIADWVDGKINIPAIAQEEVITGERLQSFCELTVLTKEIRNFHTSLQHKNLFYLDSPDWDKLRGVRSIFVYTHILEKFLEVVWPKIQAPVVLMTHNSDHIVDEKFIALLESDKLVHMFSQNATIQHSKLTCLPIGLANSMWPHGDTSSLSFLSNNNDTIERLDDILANFRVGTYAKHRSGVESALQSVARFKADLSYRDCLRATQLYRYNACPRGNGPDTHRLWETLYLGNIPVVDDTVNARHFSDLPIVYVRDWSAVTIDWLREQTKRLTVSGLDKLNLSYWRKLFTSKLPQTVTPPQKVRSAGNFVLAYYGKLPDYLTVCVRQIRKWNPNSDIYIGCDWSETNADILSGLEEYCVKVVYTKDLKYDSISYDVQSELR
jgi:hypothetical protein